MRAYWLLADLLRVRTIRGVLLLIAAPLIWFGLPLILAFFESRGVDMLEAAFTLTVYFIIRIGLTAYCAIAGLWTVVIGLAE